ncbi:MAG TPA: SulP family inorganic anion transporter [Steroidobacteraceae bacterium]|nr:SulP family inorganic anion transporter [Steroidobacteraceae bacterium]
MPSQVHAWLPLPSWISHYRPEWLRPDIFAGLTTAAVVIPKAMAYATVAGLPLAVGLYTAFVPMIIYAVLGTSRALSVSTTTTIAILTGAELGTVVPNADPALLLQATATLTLLVGLILIVASLLRLGFTANFISEPVLIGFKAGIGIVIVVDQIPKLLGIHFHKGRFVHNATEIVQGLSATSWATLAVGLGTMAALVALEKLRPKWPAPLIAVGACIAAAMLWHWQDVGIELVGAVPTGLPPLRLPALTLAEQMWPAAAGIALMSFAETAAVGRAFVKEQEPWPRPNVELAATGIANAAGAFFGAMPAGGGTSQTAVNRLAGAMTPVASMVTALSTVLVMFLLAPYIAFMPQATLAGVIIVYSVGLVQLADFRAVFAVRRTEFIWATVALLGVVLIGTLQGIVLAIIVSIIALGQQVAHPPVQVLVRKAGTRLFRPRSDEHPQDQSPPGLLILRPSGRLFFLNAEHVAGIMRGLVEQHRPRAVLLDLSAVFDFEYTALKMLVEAERRMHEQGRQLLIAAPNDTVLNMLERSPLGQRIGRQQMFYDVASAVTHFESQLETESRIQGKEGTGSAT